MKEQHPPYLSPQPLVQHQLPMIVVNQYQYQYQYKDRRKFEAPALSCDQLSVVVEGANVVERRLEGQCQRGMIQPGDVTIVPRGSASSWMPEIVMPSKAIHLLILPKLWMWASQAADVDQASIQLRDDFAAPDQLIQQLSVALLAEAEALDAEGMLYGQTLAQALAMHLLRHYTTTKLKNERSPKAHKFKQSLDYIETYLAENLSLETLSAIEGLSPYHFARSFKAAVGKTPHQFVLYRRIERAKHLILTTQLPLSQIAQKVG